MIIEGRLQTATQELGPYKVVRSFAIAVGDRRDWKSDVDIERADVPNIVMVVAGTARVEELGGGNFVEMMQVGMTNHHFPGLRAGVLWRAIALTEDCEFYCISRIDNARFNAAKFERKAGESLFVPFGGHALIGGGDTNKGESPLLVDASEGEISVMFTTDGFGLVLS